MKNFIILSCGLAGILLMGPLVKAAVAGPMTGTWSGLAGSCAAVIGTSDTHITDVPITIKISEDGKDLNVEVSLDTTELTDELNGTHLYEGETKKNGKKGDITQCGTTFGPKGSFTGAIGNLKVATKKRPETITHLKGNLLALDEPNDEAGICVFDLVTHDPTDPNVLDCP